MAFFTVARAQTEGRVNKPLKELLAGVRATFVFPEGFTEILPLNNDKTAFQYAVELPNADFEMRMQINETRGEWKKFERAKNDPDKVNPDSLYTKVAAGMVGSMAGDGKLFTRAIPASVLHYYNADLGRSYFFSLNTSATARHYQYALLVIIQKSHVGSIAVICFGNDRGPDFFKKVNMLRNCLKFNL